VTTTMPVPTISAWSAVSAFGVGRDRFRHGLRAGRQPLVALDPNEWPAPVGEACLVPGGSPRELLGRKGTRSMDRATALAVAAVGQLLGPDAGCAREAGEDTGLVLGTSTGSVASIMTFTRDSLTQDKPYLVDPARFPNTVMNCAAGRSAIWHGLRGPNVTIAGGRAAALLALNHACRLQRAGRARGVVCGAVEEFSVERAWLDWHTRAAQDEQVPPGEGCAVLLLESEPADDRPRLAELVAVEVGLATEAGDVRTVLADCVHRALAQAGVTPADLWVVAACGAPGRYGDEERTALADLGTPAAASAASAASVRCTDLLGDTCAASAAFQIAAVLALAKDDATAVGRTALVTTADRDGVVGCALLRIAEGSQS
jgi:3-oxoacyl-[acyl-carrier-protein] synthase II